MGKPKGRQGSSRPLHTGPQYNHFTEMTCPSDVIPGYIPRTTRGRAELYRAEKASMGSSNSVSHQLG